MHRCAVLVMLVGACEKRAEPPASQPAAAPARDPWAGTPSEAHPDPWARAASEVPSASTEPAPTTAPAGGDGGGLPAGTYACQQMRYTVNSPPTYVPTGISFELDGNGGYSAPHFTGGGGTVSFDGNVMMFTGGAMNGWHGYSGSTGSGPYVRIRMKEPTAIATELRLGDANCYLQK